MSFIEIKINDVEEFENGLSESERILYKNGYLIASKKIMNKLNIYHRDDYYILYPPDSSSMKCCGKIEEDNILGMFLGL